MSCTFSDNGNVPTKVLCDDVLRIVIHPNSARLRAADPRCHLDELLFAMLQHAPHPLGQRYVATCLLTAHQRGKDGVVEAAKAWLDNLFLPMLVISKAIKKRPTLGDVRGIIETMEHVNFLSGVEQFIPTPTIARRENYRCAITSVFDHVLACKLSKENRFEEIPTGALHEMAPAHIIPFLLNQLEVPTTRWSGLINAPHTLEMLRSWTQIDFTTLLESDIDSPANSIYMTTIEHLAFGNFDFYFDKEAFPDVPNKYKARAFQDYNIFSSGSSEADVEFPTLEESSIEPPNPDYLRVHAAFAKVLNLCGAVQYVEDVELEAEMEGTLEPNGEMDYAAKLLSKLAIIS